MLGPQLPLTNRWQAVCDQMWHGPEDGGLVRGSANWEAESVQAAAMGDYFATNTFFCVVNNSCTEIAVIISATGAMCVLRTCTPRRSLQSAKRKAVVSVARLKRKEEGEDSHVGVHVARGVTGALALWATDSTWRRQAKVYLTSVVLEWVRGPHTGEQLCQLGWFRPLGVSCPKWLCCAKMSRRGFGLGRRS
jgi:hypothetical protein